MRIIIREMFRIRIFSQIVKRATNRTMSTKEIEVIIQDVGDKGIIVLNRPKAMNSVNMSMINTIYTTLLKWEKEKKLVIIKGNGENVFSAGGDAKAVTQGGLKKGQEFFRIEYTTNALIGSYKIPYIAFIDGIVMGGGAGLSIHGRYRITTERTVFAMPEVRMGLFPDAGGSYYLPRLSGRLGWYLGLTGVRLKGCDTLKAGIATHYTASDNLKNLEDELLQCSNENEIKSVLRKFHQEDKSEFSLGSYLEKINHCFSAPTVEGIYERIEQDGSKWAQDTIKLLNKMSPTSLKITHKQLELGKHMTLDECMNMEYRLIVRCMEGHDLKEGVRALLIDKDLRPKWSPKNLKDVTSDIVDRHFEKLPEDQELKSKL